MSTAAAQVAAHALGDLGTRRPLRANCEIDRHMAWITSSEFLGHRERGTDLARSTVPTLKSVMLDESDLKGMKVAVRIGQSLDRAHPATVYLDRQGQARKHALVIEQNSAGATGTLVAAQFRACQADLLTQEVEQRHSWIFRSSVVGSVDADRHARLRLLGYFVEQQAMWLWI